MSRVLQNILPQRKLLISIIIFAVVVILATLIVAGRANKQSQAAPKPLDIQVVQVSSRTRPFVGSRHGKEVRTY
jgi:heme A synthase